jgi:hypothetical protein
MENKMMPAFPDKVQELVSLYHVPYLDLTGNSNKYAFTDGNHLYKASAKIVSSEISDWIKTVTATRAMTNSND